MSLNEKFCEKPFTYFDVYSEGQTFLCCSAWLPHTIGKLSKSNPVKDVFNSPMAIKIRESILDGSFRYCNHTLCPKIQNETLPKKTEVTDPRFKEMIEKNITHNITPAFFNLCYDDSCNLACPSCRKTKISLTQGPVYDKAYEIQQQIIKEVFDKPHNRNCTVSVTGTGDPFGSKLFRDLLFSIEGEKYPNVKINLQTNGVMFTPKYWDKMKKIHKNINAVLVSWDAGTPETYKITRRGGNWKLLQKNMKFLAELRSQNKIKGLRLDFVVQHANYKEMSLVISMGKKLKVDLVYFSRVINWGTWTGIEFNKHAIWKVTHPEHSQFINLLKDPIFDDEIVSLGNLSEYRKKNKSRVQRRLPTVL